MSVLPPLRSSAAAVAGRSPVPLIVVIGTALAGLGAAFGVLRPAEAGPAFSALLLATVTAAGVLVTFLLHQRAVAVEDPSLAWASVAAGLVTVATVVSLILSPRWGDAGGLVPHAGVPVTVLLTRHLVLAAVLLIALTPLRGRSPVAVVAVVAAWLVVLAANPTWLPQVRTGGLDSPTLPWVLALFAALGVASIGVAVAWLRIARRTGRRAYLWVGVLAAMAGLEAIAFAVAGGPLVVQDLDAATALPGSLAFALRHAQLAVPALGLLGDARPLMVLLRRKLEEERTSAGRTLALLDRQLLDGDGHRATSAATFDHPVNRLLDAGELDIHFQPVYDLRTGRLHCAEALARIPQRFHAAGLERAPLPWFDAAETLGRRGELELLAALSAVQAAERDWPEGVGLAVNLSAATLTCPQVLDLVAASPLRLTIEVTEHDRILDLDATLDALRRLRELGAGVAMDDVGAGYAGLTHVLDLHPDTLKIDRAIVTGVSLDPTRQALIEALVRFCDRSELRLVAEGIEDADDLQTLVALGIGFGQGYYLGRPAAGCPPARSAVPVV